MKSRKHVVGTICWIMTCAFVLFLVNNAAATEFNEAVSVKGTITATETISGVGMVPAGGIVMYSGDVQSNFDQKGTGKKSTAYEGWQLCNGEKNSPDLRDRFIAVAGGKYKIKETGGLDEVKLTIGQLPKHTHKGNISSSGGHSHDIEGTDAKGLAWRKRRIPGQTTVDMGYGGGSNADPNHEHWRGTVNTSSNGSHGHRIDIQTTGADQPHENRPAFYALAFIMRLPTPEK